jgi:hypothetical protein
MVLLTCLSLVSFAIWLCLPKYDTVSVNPHDVENLASERKSGRYIHRCIVYLRRFLNDDSEFITAVVLFSNPLSQLQDKDTTRIFNPCLWNVFLQFYYQ